MSIETTTPVRPAGNASGRFDRLTTFDRMYLSDERPAWPCHFGGLAVVEGAALLDGSGRLRLGDITERLNRRLARVPALRRRLYSPGLARGGPLWVDDERFGIDRHVHAMAIPSPGGYTELLETAASLYGRLLDRTRPLWELWFLTGLAGGRVGVLLKLHHAVADGNAAVAILGSLFDPTPDATDPVLAPWTARPTPSGWALLIDNLAGVIRTLIRRATQLAHPMRIVGAARVFAMVTRRMIGHKGAPRTSLNQVVRAGRRVGFLRLDLGTMKQVAHRHEGTVNDVVLGLWSGGLRSLLASRGERVAGVELVTAQAVSTRSASDAAVDNQAGTVVMPLPTWEADVDRRLELIVRRTRKAKAGQRSAAIAGVLAGLSTTPIARYLNLHQHAVNVIVTNVVGPPAPMYIMGARILEILPIIQLVGNVGLTLCAFSYAGEMFLVVTADATGFPDLDVLMDGMEGDWSALMGVQRGEPVTA